MNMDLQMEQFTCVIQVGPIKRKASVSTFEKEILEVKVREKERERKREDIGLCYTTDFEGEDSAMSQGIQVSSKGQERHENRLSSNASKKNTALSKS